MPFNKYTAMLQLPLEVYLVNFYIYLVNSSVSTNLDNLDCPRGRSKVKLMTLGEGHVGYKETRNKSSGYF